MNQNTVTSCCLCSQIHGNAENDVISRLIAEHTYRRRIPMESSHFAVVPDIGPLAPGHSLICPKVHVRSFAQLHHELNAEYHELKAIVSNHLRSSFGAPVHCFEHGSAAHDSRIVCSISHAHVHMLPGHVEVLEVLLSSDARWEAIPLDLDDLQKRTAGDEYLFYEDPSGHAFIARASGCPFDSQYMRRLFAQRLNKDHDWNWRENLLPHEADRTFRTLMGQCEPLA